jgi:virulence-associated protein VapD
MFAIAFDLVVADVEGHYPRHFSQAYAEIETTLRRFGFGRIQGSVYTCDREDLANLSSAMVALRALPWFPTCVRDIRAFRVEQWSDFTAFMKEPQR